MSSPISESIITIAVILAAATISTAMIQSLNQISSVGNSLLSSAEDSLAVKFKIVFAAKNSVDLIKIWIKNTGVNEVDSSVLSKFALFAGPKGNVSFIPFSASNPPSWNYSLINDLDSDLCIDPGETIEVEISFGSEVTPGDWYVRFITPFGTFAEYTFSVGG
ncbi:MAG: hypothetical protein ACP5KV_03095 [Candidatus Methanomethylicaceae archaeon]